MSIVQTGHPALRAEARELTRDEIKSAEIQELIEIMREVMRAAPGVGLAAPQIGESIKLTVIEDEAGEKTKMSEEELNLRERYPVPFHVLINPILTPIGDEKVDFFEGCLSVAGFAANVARFRSVNVKALNEKGEEVSINAKGWYARILQHEIDHLNGILYIDRMYSTTFTTVENKARYWDSLDQAKPKSQ
jgi:peptide deformylase